LVEYRHYQRWRGLDSQPRDLAEHQPPRLHDLRMRRQRQCLDRPRSARSADVQSVALDEPPGSLGVQSASPAAPPVSLGLQPALRDGLRVSLGVQSGSPAARAQSRRGRLARRSKGYRNHDRFPGARCLY
jgi:hypothetical protein